MCGIAGILTPGGGDAPALRDEALAMARALAHRGPDGEGAWAEPRGDVALAHRRLAILDLSPEGAQPMVSHGGRYVVSFNGEVYNLDELRRDLGGAGARFRGRSDTEVLLAAVEAWGLPEALRRSAGMWALALWDREERVLHLARDRVGKKPLYYGQIGPRLLFGSELQAMRTAPGFEAALDRDALALYLRHGHVPSPHTIHTSVRKVPPGAVLSFRCEGQTVRAPELTTIWSARDAVAAARSRPFSGSAREAVDGLEEVLRLAVRQRMVADVPLGALLSGGVDSSTVVALMQAASEQPVRTFTVGFRESGYDEAPQARAVAEHVGTEHVELTVTPEDALAVVSRLPRLFDEPFADASQIPTFLVCAMARRHVTVALSGDGGDEAFGGYVRHALGASAWNFAARWPHPLRVAAASALEAVPPARWDAMAAVLGPALPSRLRHRAPGEKVHKLARMLSARDGRDAYLALASTGPGGAETVLGGRAPPYPAVEPPPGLSLTEQMMFLDLVSYLPDDVLTKVDRASMAVGLEVRAPLLDHRVLAYAWSLPLDLKVRDGQGKWVLRQVLHRHVPPALVERPKAGFAVPLAAWLRGPLRDWAEDLLQEGRLREQGLLRAEVVRERWAQHLSGRRDWHAFLWSVLVFQQWLEARETGTTWSAARVQPPAGAPVAVPAGR